MYRPMATLAMQQETNHESRTAAFHGQWYPMVAQWRHRNWSSFWTLKWDSPVLSTSQQPRLVSAPAEVSSEMMLELLVSVLKLGTDQVSARKRISGSVVSNCKVQFAAVAGAEKVSPQANLAKKINVRVAWKAEFVDGLVDVLMG